MDDDYHPIQPKRTTRLECLPAGEIGKLRAEIERLRAALQRIIDEADKDGLLPETIAAAALANG